MTLEVPVGGEIILITITDRMQSIRFSLRTADRGETKRRQAEAIAYLEGIYRNLRANSPLTLTHRQCVALAGELYRSWAADLEASKRITFVADEDTGTVIRDYGIDVEAEAAAYVLEADKMDRLGGSDLERHLGPLVERLLLRRGIVAVDRVSREMLLVEFARALADGMRVRARKAGGDYRPDPNAERFPEWNDPQRHLTSTAPVVSLSGLFDDWWTEAANVGRSASTKENYQIAIAALGEFLRHDDAGRVSADDVMRFKDHLVTATNPRTKRALSAKTIKGSYLTALKSVFGWAVANKRLAFNPAESVTMKAGRRRKLRDPWFTPREREALLRQASEARQGKREPRQRFDGRRWVPWLCAYTGARVGEMIQLRKQDVRKEDGRWVLTITPEAITVKGGAGREVPLHPHLVEMGFTEFVKAAPEGFLFMWSGEGRSAWRTAKNRLTGFARKAVPDPNVAPNHGWRHTFKTIGVEAGISERTLDAICGHRPRTVGEAYGGVTLVAKAEAIGKFPRFNVRSG